MNAWSFAINARQIFLRFSYWFLYFQSIFFSFFNLKTAYKHRLSWFLSQCIRFTILHTRPPLSVFKFIVKLCLPMKKCQFWPKSGWPVLNGLTSKGFDYGFTKNAPKLLFLIQVSNLKKNIFGCVIKLWFFLLCCDYWCEWLSLLELCVLMASVFNSVLSVESIDLVWWGIFHQRD